MQNHKPDLRRSGVLPYSTILMLAVGISKEYGLPNVSTVTFRRSYDAGVPMPLILQNENGCLWVDKHYLAYELQDRVFRYAYITRQHIQEEYQAYAQARKQRKNQAYLPDAIRKIFVRATKGMNTAEENFWIFEKKAA